MNNKYRLCILRAILLFVVLFRSRSLAAELETPVEYGPAFFVENSISTDDVVLSEDGTMILAVNEATEEVVEEPRTSGNRWNVSLNESEMDTLAKIVELEAGNQSDLGQQAVVEVILNRITSANFPNDLIGVLSQKHQFSTWKYRDKAHPTSRVYANIATVINGGTEIFPFKTVFFSRGKQNNRVQARIEDHVFCNER